MGNKFTRKFKLGESKGKDAGTDGQYENKAETEVAAPKEQKINETGASSSIEAANKPDVKLQQVTIKIDEVGPNEPEPDTPEAVGGEAVPENSEPKETEPMVKETEAPADSSESEDKEVLYCGKCYT